MGARKKAARAARPPVVMAMDEIKLVIIGDGAIGKTCILRAINEPTAPWDDEYAATISENKIFDWADGNGGTQAVEVWDTAGQEGFGELRKMVYPNSNVVILGFDMTNETSLQNIQTGQGWIDEVREEDAMSTFDNWILIGTKCDLWKQGETGHVKMEDVYRVATEIKAKQCIMTSAFDKTGCEDVQHNAVKLGVAHKEGKNVVPWQPPKPAKEEEKEVKEEVKEEEKKEEAKKEAPKKTEKEESKPQEVAKKEESKKEKGASGCCA